MSKIVVRLPKVPDGWANDFKRIVETTLNDIARQLNGITEGSMAVKHSASTAAPTTGSYSVGDFVPNSTPSELGSAGSKYIIVGWTNVTAGTPGTFVQTRALTGN